MCAEMQTYSWADPFSSLNKIHKKSFWAYCTNKSLSVRYMYNIKIGIPIIGSAHWDTTNGMPLLIISIVAHAKRAVSPLSASSILAQCKYISVLLLLSEVLSLAQLRQIMWNVYQLYRMRLLHTEWWWNSLNLFHITNTYTRIHVVPICAQNVTLFCQFRWPNCQSERSTRSPFYLVCSISQWVFISCKSFEEKESTKMVLQFIRNRTSTYLVAVITSAFFIERTIQLGGDAYFDSVNKNVSISSIFDHTICTRNSFVNRQMTITLHNHQLWNWFTFKFAQCSLSSYFPVFVAETMEGHRKQLQIIADPKIAEGHSSIKIKYM